MIWMWSKRIAFTLFSFLTLLLVSGATYQFVSTQLDLKNHPPLGELIDIGGYKLHFHNVGKGGPAVILDTGIGCISSDWGLVQSEIAKFTQVISYDRAGTGWSEPSPYERTSLQIAKELHLLIEKANIPKPYILVGHSFGGCNSQLYAATYPNEVLGLILVDSCHELQEKKLPIPPKVKNQIKLMQNSKLMHFMSTFGLSRWILQKRLPILMPNSTNLLKSAHLALCSSTKHIQAVSAEAKSISKSLKQLEEIDISSVKDKPCFILTAGKEYDPAKIGASKEQLQQMQIVWNELQKDLASQFKHANHLVAEKSDHMILWHEPELIVYAVKELIDSQKKKENGI